VRRLLPMAMLAVASLAIAATARAEAVTGELTLDQALAMARTNNRGLIAERAKLAQAQTNVEQAWTALFPTVGAQGKYTRNNRGFEFGGMPAQVDPVTGMVLRPAIDSLKIQKVDQLDLGINATAPLLAPAAYPALDAVKTNVRAAEATFEVSQATVLVAVARAFLASAVADEVLVARRSSIDVARATLKNAETRKASGTVTKVDVDRAELALVRAEQLEREAQYGREQAYRALATLIGAEGPFQIKPEIPAAPPPDARDVNMALHLRPEFRALELTVQSLDAQRRAHAWRWAPTLSAFGNARVFNYDNFAKEHHAWAVGAQLDWLLFDGGGRDAQRHLAAAQAVEAQARAEVLRETIRDDLANGHSQLQTKKRGLEAAERQVALSRETFDLVRVQYEAGIGTQLDLLQAQDAMVSAHLGLAQAHFDVAAADLALRHAAGTFPPH
jgi:outer membrane protein